MNRALKLIAMTTAVAIMTSSLLAAPAGKNDAPKSEESGIEKINKVLDKVDKFEFSAVTLAQVATTLSENYKLNITLDRIIINQMGLDPDSMNVELKMKDVKLRTALTGILEKQGLTFVVMSDQILVTTEEMAIHRQFKKRVSVDVDNIPLQKIVKKLANDNGIKVLIDPKLVKNKVADNMVSLQMDDIPFETAVRLLCEMAEVKPARIGNVLYVTTEARADKLKDSDNLAPPMPNPFMPGLAGGIANFVPAVPVAPGIGIGGAAAGGVVKEDKEDKAPPPAKEVPEKKQ